MTDWGMAQGHNDGRWGGCVVGGLDWVSVSDSDSGIFLGAQSKNKY